MQAMQILRPRPCCIKISIKTMCYKLLLATMLSHVVANFNLSPKLQRRHLIYRDFYKPNGARLPLPARVTTGAAPVRSTTVVGSMPQEPPSRIRST